MNREEDTQVAKQPLEVVCERLEGGRVRVQLVQPWGLETSMLAGGAILYIPLNQLFYGADSHLGSTPWQLPAVVLVGLGVFWGAGGLQDTLVVDAHSRSLVRTIKVCGIPVSKTTYRGSTPAFLMTATFGKFRSSSDGGKFEWRYRPVLIMKDGTSIPFSKKFEEAKLVGEAVAEMAGFLDVPVRTMSASREFLPPEAGPTDMDTPLPTRGQEESEPFHKFRVRRAVVLLMVILCLVAAAYYSHG